MQKQNKHITPMYESEPLIIELPDLLENGTICKHEKAFINGSYDPDGAWHCPTCGAHK